MTHAHLTFQRLRDAAAAIAVLSVLAACTQLPAPPVQSAQPRPAATPAPVPAPPAAASPAIGPQLHIDTANSLIAVTVRRGGVLARLGHDHVVASHNVTGTVSPAQNRADLQFRLDEMKVDEADLRRIAGLEKQPSADAIDGTRHNMLTKVLDAERYPVVSIHAERTAPGQPLQVSITLHGVTRTQAIPVKLREENGVMTVKGTVTLKQTDFGLTPFSVMGGAMAVEDQMELRFDLMAK
jgi:polyisoprenoid-binding protein YceI